MVKLSQSSFDYYLLQINPATTIEDIEAKLISLKNLDSKNNTVVIALDAYFELTELTLIIDFIKHSTEKLSLSLHSILKNNNINIPEISGLRVISWPESNRSAPILNKTLIFDDPVRSGMCLENDGDIIITSFVSDNAEIIASGNIHIYGEAKGKLVAGSKGDKNAQIFTANFNAELIAIGGIYRVIENKLPMNINQKMVRIRLDDKSRLNIIPLN